LECKQDSDFAVTIPQISTQPIHPNRAQEPFVSHRADGCKKFAPGSFLLIRWQRIAAKKPMALYSAGK